MQTSIELVLAGENVVARGDRTLYWPSERTLFVADLHLGKGAAFRAGGVPVPEGTTAKTLAVLSDAASDAGAKRIVVLGDLWHARAGRTPENERAFARWREQIGCDLVLVLGNHDRHAGAEEDAVPPGVALGPFRLHHYPDPDPDCYVLSGHLHPAFRLEGRGGDSVRLPCFWFGREVGVLPALGDLTGVAAIRPRSGDRVVVVADEKAALVPIRDRNAVRRR